MVCGRQPMPRPLFPDLLEPCPMCGRLFCNRCAVRRGGRDFCASRCGDTFFFFSAEDEDSGIDDD